MQKSKNMTILICIFILLYIFIANLKLIFLNNIIYYYIINPLFWLILCVFLKISIGKNRQSFKLEKKVRFYTYVAILIYIIIYALSGIFLTYGKNPYLTTFSGIITNLWIFGVEIVAKEYIRFQLIQNVYGRDKIKIAILLSAVYIVGDIGVWQFMTNTLSFAFVFRIIAQSIFPSLCKNILCSYIAINSSCYSAILYNLVTNLYFWIAPILPNSPWIMNAILDSSIAIILFLYIRFAKYKSSKFVTKQELKDSDPKNIIILIILVILAILFAIGIFPIKPIAIATGSMEKELMVGDVTIIQKVDAKDIVVGDIIEYTEDNHSVVHRVIQKKQVNSIYYFITKGDNNNTADSGYVTEKQVIGKVIFKIRYIGYPAIWLNLTK